MYMILNRTRLASLVTVRLEMAGYYGRSAPYELEEDGAGHNPAVQSSIHDEVDPLGHFSHPGCKFNFPQTKP